MGYCSNKGCGRYVFWVGIVLTVLGLIAAIYGYAGLDINEAWQLGDLTIPSPTAIFGYLAITVGILTIVTGIFGALAGHFKVFCFTLPFQILVTVVSLFMFILACVAIVGASKGDDLHKAICNNEGGAAIHVGDKEFDNMEQFMHAQYGGVVDQFMCTKLCPCDQALLGVWAKATTGDGFEFVPADGNTPARHRTAFASPSQFTPPQDLLTASNIPMYFDQKSTDTVNNFQECFEKHISPFMNQAAGAAEGEDSDEVKMMKLALAFFGQIETQLKTCSGACAVPLFGIARAVADGPPEEECVDTLLKSLDSLMAPGVVLLLTSFVLFGACCAGFCLCCGGTDDSDNMEGEAYAEGTGGFTKL